MCKVSSPREEESIFKISNFVCKKIAVITGPTFYLLYALRLPWLVFIAFRILVD